MHSDNGIYKYERVSQSVDLNKSMFSCMKIIQLVRFRNKYFYVKMLL